MEERKKHSRESNGLAGKRSNAFKDRTGQVYGFLEVLSQAGEREVAWCKSKIPLWRCLCLKCGREVIRPSTALAPARDIDIRTCGCRRKEKGLMTYAAKSVSYKKFLTKYKHVCKKTGRKWGLTDVEAIEFFKSSCFYCGIEAKTDNNPSPNGIDRKDNDVGYEVGNCIPACRTCNFAKRDMTFEMFLDWLSRVSQHQCWE